MTSSAEVKKASWGVLFMLGAAQFIMVLDTTVMNVSISQVAADLNTTVVGMQTAITMYTLVMASFMLLGGKLGDKWGAKRAYTIGLLIYSAGSLTTALSPNLTVLLIGWSFVEGFGAVLVIPAIAALTAATYAGRQRAIAYGVLGGVIGASAALGPLIGGWVTENYSWRYVFIGEVVVILVLLLFLRMIPATQGRANKLDMGGAVLSAAGLGSIVFGILMSSQWGWVTPSSSAPVTPLGLSPVFWLILIGVLLLGNFVRHEEIVVARGEEPLLDMKLLQIPRLRAGLTTFFSQPFITMSTFFVLPVFLQTVLGYDALETGLIMLPLSVSLFIFALGGAALTGRFSPKRLVSIGLGAILIGEFLLVGFTSIDFHATGFKIAMILVGSGLGLLASQLSNVIMSSVKPERGSEVGGLQGTVQNLAASLGTALIGSILIASLVSNFQAGVMANPELTSVSSEVSAAAEQNATIVTVDQVEAAAEAAGLPPEQVDAITAEYADAQIAALKAAFAGIALFSLIALIYVRRLPTKAGDGEEPVEEDQQPVPQTG